MLGRLSSGRLCFHKPLEAPTTGWDAALRPRHSLVKLVDLEPAVQHGSFRVPRGLCLWADLRPLLEPLQVHELGGHEHGRRPLVHDVASGAGEEQKEKRENGEENEEEEDNQSADAVDEVH